MIFLLGPHIPSCFQLKLLESLSIIPTPMVSSCRLHFVDIANKGKNQSSQWILIMPTFWGLSYFVSTTMEGMLQACNAIKEKEKSCFTSFGS